jgi:uncharacterized membrane protein
MRWRGLIRGHVDPHVILGFEATLVLLLEALRGPHVVHTSPTVPAVQGLAAAGAFVLVWRQQHRLRLGPLLAIALAFQVVWIIVHYANDVASEPDVERYGELGKVFLAGHYPSAEYPVGAVLLFALESLLAGGGASSVRLSHALLMVPLQLVTVVAVWTLKTRWSGWFAAVVALWPLNAFYWEFKFDSAPAAALAIGLVLAARKRWGWSAVTLGLGASLKWTPALAGLLLVIWLFASGFRRRSMAYLAALVATFLIVDLPFLVLWPHEVLSAYTQQAGRGLTPESLFYMPLRPLGLAAFPGQIWDEAEVPGWANPLAIGVQALTLCALAWAAARVRGNLVAGVSVAGLGPVVFLLTNRVFSPQFFVLFVAVWAVCGSLLARSYFDQLVLGFLVFGATLGNVLVYPVIDSHWGAFSVLAFGFSFAACGWVLVRAFEARPSHSAACT